MISDWKFYMHWNQYTASGKYTGDSESELVKKIEQGCLGEYCVVTLLGGWEESSYLEERRQYKYFLKRDAYEDTLYN